MRQSEGSSVAAAGELRQVLHLHPATRRRDLRGQFVHPTVGLGHGRPRFARGPPTRPGCPVSSKASNDRASRARYSSSQPSSSAMVATMLAPGVGEVLGVVGPQGQHQHVGREVPGQFLEPCRPVESVGTGQARCTLADHLHRHASSTSSRNDDPRPTEMESPATVTFDSRRVRRSGVRFAPGARHASSMAAPTVATRAAQRMAGPRRAPGFPVQQRAPGLGGGPAGVALRRARDPGASGQSPCTAGTPTGRWALNRVRCPGAAASGVVTADAGRRAVRRRGDGRGTCQTSDRSHW